MNPARNRFPVQARFRQRTSPDLAFGRLTRELAGLAGVIGWALLPVCIALWPEFAGAG